MCIFPLGTRRIRRLGKNEDSDEGSVLYSRKTSKPEHVHWSPDQTLNSRISHGKRLRLDLLYVKDISHPPQMCLKDGKGSSVITTEACRRTDLMFINFIFLKPKIWQLNF